MKAINLTQGKIALVDDEDYAVLSTTRWRANRMRTGEFEARGFVYQNGCRKQPRLHRFVMERFLDRKLNIDELIIPDDGNYLNCQKSNLKVVSTLQRRAKILLGQRFERIKVIDFIRTSDGLIWKYKCLCGKEGQTKGASLKAGLVKSCGCLRLERFIKRNTVHGKWKHRFYYTWKGMVARCYDPLDYGWSFYGGRGIKTCDEWRDNPTKFLEWCDSQNPEQGLQLDRIDVNGNYCPENCRFISAIQQQRNKRDTLWVNYCGQRVALRNLYDLLNPSQLPYSTLLHRIQQGWELERALTQPRKVQRNSRIIGE